MVSENERGQRVKEFVKRFAWKGPVFEISALTREGCEELIGAIYDHLAVQRQREVRAEEIRIAEEARGIATIDPDDPRFKVVE